MDQTAHRDTQAICPSKSSHIVKTRASEVEVSWAENNFLLDATITQSVSARWNVLKSQRENASIGSRLAVLLSLTIFYTAAKIATAHSNFNNLHAWTRSGFAYCIAATIFYPQTILGSVSLSLRIKYHTCCIFINSPTFAGSFWKFEKINATACITEER